MTPIGQLLIRRDLGELDSQETRELYEQLLHTARKETDMDVEEITNELYAEAWDMVMEDEFYLRTPEHYAATPEYLEARVRAFVLPTLVDITLLPVTYWGDER